MRHFHYVGGEQGEVMRITARRRPSEKTKPVSTTWIAHMMIDNKWLLPSFPEITWGQLKTLDYLGSTPVPDKGET